MKDGRAVTSSFGREHEYLYGKRFHYLKALHLSQYREHNSFWLCECRCGRKAIVTYEDLLSGRIQACGVCTFEG